MIEVRPLCARRYNVGRSAEAETFATARPRLVSSSTRRILRPVPRHWKSSPERIGCLTTLRARVGDARMSATEQPLAPAVPSAPAGVDGAGPSTSEPAAKPGGRGRGRGRGRGPGRGRGRGRGRGAAADKKGKAPADGGDEDDKEDANPAPEIDQKKRKRGILTRDRKWLPTRADQKQQSLVSLLPNSLFEPSRASR